MTKTITIEYYALLKEKRGTSRESIQTDAQTARQLYEELHKKYQFPLSVEALRVAVNDEFSRWNHILKEGDRVIFIPPVAGG